jgi:oligoendopeptidase F
MDITHFFEYPFYVISYPVSLSVAMQIYDLERQQPGLGMEKYFEILPRDYENFMDTVVNGGLESPFDEGSMASVARLIGDTLGYKGPYADAA